MTGRGLAEAYDESLAALVMAWSAAGEGPAAAQLLTRALEGGLAGLELSATDRQVDPAGVPLGLRRRCEIALVRLAGVVDEAGYLAHNPEQADRGADPVEHFCRRGWRALRNPSLDFDVWWYIASHLDPSDDSETAVSPLVHYLLVGRHLGLSPTPVAKPVPSAAPLTSGTGAQVRRACLFAAYDRDGLIDDTVVAYVGELARHAEVFVLLDGDAKPGQLARLDALASNAWARPHGAHDFGSWSLLARELVGWAALADYDEVLLANDSCWLVGSLDQVFADMDERACDFWGLQITHQHFTPDAGQTRAVPLSQVRRSWLPRTAYRYHELPHLGSYFLALRREVVADAGLQRRLDSVVAQRDRTNLVQKYETGTTRYLIGSGYAWDCWVPDLLPYHPMYGPGAFDLLAQGFPLLKRRFLVDNPFDTPGLAAWTERVLAACPDAPVEMMQAHVRRVADPERLAASLGVMGAEGEV